MEHLRVAVPPKELFQVQQPTGINVKALSTLTENNNTKVQDFLQAIWGIKNKSVKEPSADELYAKKTGVMIHLEQYSKEEIKNLYSSIIEKKFHSNVNQENKIQLDDLNTNIERIKEKVKKEKRKKTILNGPAEDTFEEHHEILEKYSYYLNNDNFKYDLHKKYILNNKTSFLNEFHKKMMGLNLLVEDDSCDSTGDENSQFQPLIHQLIVKQYLNSFSPYRGLLLYHGLGSGKTCSSVGIIESMKYNKDHIFVLTPASLQKNYKTQMKFCGNQIFKDSNYWERVEIPTDSTRESFIHELFTLTHLPKKYIRKQSFVFLINKEKPGESNYHELSNKEKEQLHQQIDLMIENKFTFINYNGITQNIWNTKYTENGTLNPFHHSVIIIDEGHNFVSRIVNKINKKQESVSTKMYDMIMGAENCNVVILSGTPLINYPCELGVLFNLIGGYNFSYEFRVSHGNRNLVSQKSFVNLFRANLKTVDLIEYMPFTNVLRITQNPFGFIRNTDGTIQYDEEFGKISSSEFKIKIVELLKTNGYKIMDKKTVLYKKFPDDEVEFNKMFVGSKNNFVKKTYFQSKIVGMVSYLGDKKSLMPDVIVPDETPSNSPPDDIFIERVKMNDYVLKEYSIERKKETEIDKRNRKKASMKNQDSFSSSYRIFSRSACNFVFPENIVRPMPHKALEKITDIEIDNLDEEEILAHNDGMYDETDVTNIEHNQKTRYAMEIEQTLMKFEQRASEFFESSIEKMVSLTEAQSSKIKESQRQNLFKFSPKMHRILENILDSDNIGLHLLYSNFRNLGGIGIFIKILDYYGYTRFKITKENKITGAQWRLDLSHPYYTSEQFNGSRKFYALYTGKESTEEKEIIRNIFNGDFQKVPLSLREQLYKEFSEKQTLTSQTTQGKLSNKFGEILNLLIISASGAEGIDLKNVRFVHIMEPYWHPVRISQVIGRARRICSHKDLPEEFRNVKVFMYMLTYDSELIEKKRDNYIDLLMNDRDDTGTPITTDEKLYQVMNRKKKLMDEFLTGIKEASIDCLVNYSDKSKCLTFPSSSSKHTRMISDINYKNDKHNVFQKKENLKSYVKDNNNDNEISDDVEEEDNKLLMKKEIRMFKLYTKEDKTNKKRFAVDVSSEPKKVFDYEGFVKYGQLFEKGFIQTDDEGRQYVA